MLGRRNHHRLAVLCGALFAALLVTTALTQAVLAADNRAYAAAKYVLSLAKSKGGYIKSFEGGRISAEVIQEPVGPSSIIAKHIGKPKYEPIAVEVGFNMPKSFYDTVSKSWTAKAPSISGSVAVLDYDSKPRSTIEFTNALISETTIPACDAASKEPGYIRVVFDPETIRSGSGSEGKVGQEDKVAQKAWLPANFILTIDGLDCTKVSKIDSFTVKLAAVQDKIGEARDYQKEPGKLEFPNLRITLSESAAKGWYGWHESFVVKGDNGSDQEKSGVISFLSADKKTELAQVKLYNLGIFRIGPERTSAGSEQVSRVIAELYCERMELIYTNKPIAESAPAAAADSAAPAASSAPTASADSAAPAAAAPPATKTVVAPSVIDKSAVPVSPANLTVSRPRLAQ